MDTTDEGMPAMPSQSDIDAAVIALAAELGGTVSPQVAARTQPAPTIPQPGQRVTWRRDQYGVRYDRRPWDTGTVVDNDGPIVVVAPDEPRPAHYPGDRYVHGMHYVFTVVAS